MLNKAFNKHELLLKEDRELWACIQIIRVLHLINKEEEEEEEKGVEV